MPRRSPYTEEVKRAAVARMLAPDAPPILRLARELGISEPTLHKWKTEALAQRGGTKVEEPVTRYEATGSDDVSGLRRKVQELERQLAEKNAQVAELSLTLLRQAGVLKT